MHCNSKGIKMKNYLLAPLVSLLVISGATTAEDYDKPISDFTQNVLTHVLLHEMGHALLREFEIPILGNEENIADIFATNYITRNMRDESINIITHRAQSWMVEDQQVNAEDYDLMGEHALDIRRAYRSLCLLYGADPAERAKTVSWVEFSENDLTECSNIAPELRDSWAATLKPLYMKKGKLSKNVEVIFGEGPYKKVMMETELLEQIANIMRQFDWPKPVVLHFDHCSEKSYWSRSDAKITLCDNYLERFIEQESLVSNL